MKKFIFLLIFAFASPALWACDACGCGPGAAFLQLFPNYKYHSLSVGVQNYSGARDRVISSQGTLSIRWNDSLSLKVGSTHVTSHFDVRNTLNQWESYTLSGWSDPFVGFSLKRQKGISRFQWHGRLFFPLAAGDGRNNAGQLLPITYQLGAGNFTGDFQFTYSRGDSYRGVLSDVYLQRGLINRYGSRKSFQEMVGVFYYQSKEGVGNTHRLLTGLQVKRMGASLESGAEHTPEALLLNASVQYLYMLPQGILYVGYSPMLKQWGTDEFVQKQNIQLGMSLFFR